MLAPSLLDCIAPVLAGMPAPAAASAPVEGSGEPQFAAVLAEESDSDVEEQPNTPAKKEDEFLAVAVPVWVWPVAALAPPVTVMASSVKPDEAAATFEKPPLPDAPPATPRDPEPLPEPVKFAVDLKPEAAPKSPAAADEEAAVSPDKAVAPKAVQPPLPPRDVVEAEPIRVESPPREAIARPSTAPPPEAELQPDRPPAATEAPPLLGKANLPHDAAPRVDAPMPSPPGLIAGTGESPAPERLTALKPLSRETRATEESTVAPREPGGAPPRSLAPASAGLQLRPREAPRQAESTLPDSEPQVVAFTGRVRSVEQPSMEVQFEPERHRESVEPPAPAKQHPQPALARPSEPAAEPQPQATPRRTDAPAPAAPIRTIDPPETPQRPLNQIHVRFTTPDDSTVALRFRQSGGGVDVGVRVSNPQTAEALRAELPQLTERLGREGLQTDFKIPIHQQHNVMAAPAPQAAAETRTHNHSEGEMLDSNKPDFHNNPGHQGRKNKQNPEEQDDE